MPTIKVKDRQGNAQDFNLDMTLYQRSKDEKINPRLAVRYMASDQGVEWDPSKGDLMDQLYASSGLLDGQFGGNSLNFKDLQNMNLSDGFRKPDGSDNSLGARLLFPQMILDTLRENALETDGSDTISWWGSVIALNTNLDGARAEQPIINTSGPEESRSGRVAQLAEPETMVSITTGQKSYRVPTRSIGLLISDEAQQASSVDLVRIVMEAQARGERYRRVQQQIEDMVKGNDDLDMDPLDPVDGSTFDGDASSKITKKMYIKWLLDFQSRANITQIMCNFDDALKLDNVLTSDKNPDPGQIQAPFNGINLNLPTPVFTPFDFITAGQYVGFDPRYAIQRFVNVSASYEAIEEYVMRKATGFRVDYGEMATRLYDGAWSVLDATS